MSDLAALTIIPTAPLARPLLDFLAENGITGYVQPEDNGAFYPALNFSSGGTSVLVALEDLDRARELMRVFLTPGETDEELEAEATARPLPPA